MECAAYSLSSLVNAIEGHFLKTNFRAYRIVTETSVI